MKLDFYKFNGDDQACWVNKANHFSINTTPILDINCSWQAPNGSEGYVACF